MSVSGSGRSVLRAQGTPKGGTRPPLVNVWLPEVSTSAPSTKGTPKAQGRYVRLEQGINIL